MCMYLCYISYLIHRRTANCAILVFLETRRGRLLQNGLFGFRKYGSSTVTYCATNYNNVMLLQFVIMGHLHASSLLAYSGTNKRQVSWLIGCCQVVKRQAQGKSYLSSQLPKLHLLSSKFHLFSILKFKRRGL